MKKVEVAHGERSYAVLVQAGLTSGNLSFTTNPAEALSNTGILWVTFDTPEARDALRDEADVTWAYHPTTRHLGNLVRNAGLAHRTLRRVRPTIIVSTGAGVAYPFFLAARLRRIRTVYVEVYDRIDGPTLTGRLCSPVTDLMLVQWDEQRVLYDDAVTVGRLL